MSGRPGQDPVGVTETNFGFADVAEPPRAAAAPSEPGSPPPGYEILGLLGRGGMGVVYKARDVRLGRIVALKMLPGGEHSGQSAREALRREAATLAALGHPNLVSVYEVGEHRGLPYVSLEYCAGGTLAARLAGRPVPAKRAAALLEVAARAVAAAHRAGLVHRDIKPANVLLTADGTPKVSDFGLAKPTDSQDLTRTGEAKGTLMYMPPEQAEGAKVITPAADVYALGAVLYEMLTGRPPFLADSEAHLIFQLVGSEPVAVRSLAPRTPRDLETICHKCLSKDPRRRYPHAGELADDLRRFLSGEPVRARPAGWAETAVRWARRKPAAAALAAVSSLAVVGGAAVGAAFVSQVRESNRALAESDRAAREEAAKARDAEAAARAERDRAVAAEASAAEQRDEAVAARRDAEANFALARRAASDILELASRHPVFQKPGMQEARELLARKAGEYHRILGESRSEGDVRLATARALMELVRSSAEVRSRSAAISDVRKALSLFEEALTASPEDPEIAHERAAARLELAMAVKIAGGAGAARESLDLADKASAEFGELARRRPTDPRPAVMQARCRTFIGDQHDAQGRGTAALETYRESVEALTGALGRHPAHPGLERELAIAHDHVGRQLLRNGRPADALRSNLAALEIQRRLVAAQPAGAEGRASLASIAHDAANALDALGRGAEALPLHREALGVATAVLAENPAARRYRLVRYDALRGLAASLRRAGRHAEAVPLLRELAALAADLAREYPALPRYPLDEAYLRMLLGCSLRDSGDPGDAGAARAAVAELEAAQALYAKLAARPNPEPVVLKERDACLRELEKARRAAGP
jgi:serine/threonine-protein kinase